MKTLNSLLFLLLCEILFIFPGGIVLEILRSICPNLNENAAFLFAFLLSLLCLILCLKAFFPEILISLNDLLRVKKSSMYLLTALFILSGLLYSLIIIVGIKTELVKLKTSFVEDTSLVNILLLSMAALFCSAVEEIFFRGAALSYFLRKLKPWISIIIISVVFSLGHMQYAGILPYIGAFIFGVLSSILVIKTKTLYWSIGLHCGWNFAYNIYGLYFDSNIKSIPYWGNAFELLKIGVFISLLSLYLIYTGNKGCLKPVNEQRDLSKC